MLIACPGRGLRQALWPASVAPEPDFTYICTYIIIPTMYVYTYYTQQGVHSSMSLLHMNLDMQFFRLLKPTEYLNQRHEIAKGVMAECMNVCMQQVHTLSPIIVHFICNPYQVDETLLLVGAIHSFIYRYHTVDLALVAFCKYRPCADDIIRMYSICTCTLHQEDKGKEATKDITNGLTKV